MRYCFDIDGTLCTNTEGAYEEAKPFPEAIAEVNRLFDEGHQIYLYTARGSTTGIDWRETTERQMADWGVRYHSLHLGKPTADVYIDDKARRADDWHRECRAKAQAWAVDSGAVNSGAVDSATGGAPPAKSVLSDARYLEVTYAPARAPYGDYPVKLARRLLETAYGAPGRLLDVGCGRGEYLSAFAGLGFDVAGVDVSPDAPRLAGGAFPVAVADLETQPLPYPAESFDFVFSKSVVEHVRAPVSVLAKAYAALKPGGVAVVMTPSWRHTHQGAFYIDHTHVTPFTAPSLTDAMTLAGFADVRTSHFRQLPFLWEKPYLAPFVKLLGALPAPYRPLDDAPWPNELNKLIRFSKEVMLLSIGRKAR